MLRCISRNKAEMRLFSGTCATGRMSERKLVLAIADAKMLVDGREIYNATDLRVGLFTSTENL